ncbi:hypothetical protein QBC47DRAFT_440656 [Echria macrotheca]|uniref:DOMON domain-containing protein n=1 Tax=Echria macrotheca TaxID=438768 RepID=A0AAJ0FCA8_9PEZI|nr:hypothetical protein QBC47DRAFT_440656 [Echria macrotheca]
MLGHLALFALAASASGTELAQRQTAKYCPGGTQICFSESKISSHDITFRIAIPETSAAPFDILVSIIAPVSVAWTGLAWGGKMTQNPLTVAWPNGKAAVVSSRFATGRSLPGVYAGATYTVLPSTTTNATHWQLDALCKGCSQWSAGSLNPNGVVTFAYAKGSKAPQNPASNTSSFSYHDDRGTFSHDLSSAKIPQGVFDAVAYDLTKPASSAPPSSSDTPVLTSVTTLPGTALPTGNLPTTDLPTTNLPTTNLPTTNLPTTNLPTSNFPTFGFPTGGGGAPIIATSVVTLPAPSVSQIGKSTTFPSQGGVVTVTLTRDATVVATPQASVWLGPPFFGKGKGKWGGVGLRPGRRPWDVEGEDEERRRR